jgi:hypothetical protein
VVAKVRNNDKIIKGSSWLAKRVLGLDVNAEYSFATFCCKSERHLNMKYRRYQDMDEGYH